MSEDLVVSLRALAASAEWMTSGYAEGWGDAMRHAANLAAMVHETEKLKAAGSQSKANAAKEE